MAPPESADQGIEVRDVSMVLGTKRRTMVLERVSLDIPRGHFCCLVGHSGCGKSTMLNMLAGFLKPSRGTIRIGGMDAASERVRRAVVFQEYALFPWRTALGNVRFALESRGVPRSELGRAVQYLEMVGLAEARDSFPHELSGGMQQRVAIARALAYEPEFLLMDEPFGALDALTRDQLQVLVSDLWQQQNQTVAYVTHNVAEAVYLADDIMVMAAKPGRIRARVQVDLPRPRDPAHPAFQEIQRRVTGLIMGEGQDEQVTPGAASGGAPLPNQAPNLVAPKHAGGGAGR